MSPQQFDLQAMADRFRLRAAAVKARGVPPIEGPDRQLFIEQAKLDYMDYSLLADAIFEQDGADIVIRLRPRRKSES